jgi:lipoic acid synthetase
MILGSRCTRDCRFCAVDRGPTSPPDTNEPARVAQAAADLGLSYVVVTSVTRDDMADGGAAIFAETIRALRRQIPKVAVEVLIPDFQGDPDALRTVLQARPDVLNHNIETVPRLYPVVRPQADYRRSLDLLARSRAWAPDIPTKSGLMLGLGESED